MSEPAPDSLGQAASAARGHVAVTVVVPVYNKMPVIRTSLDSVMRAAARRCDVEVLLIDNGSTDGSFELLHEYAPAASVHRYLGPTIASVRNWGARQGSGSFISFIDCDIVVSPDYFDRLIAVFEASRAGAVGCECGLPAEPHWLEKAWYDLTVRTTDGDRRYLNSANFAVTRRIFDTIGGFPEDLETSEDYECCRRIGAAGHRIYQSQLLHVVHLDNPKNIRAFFRKMFWHGLGMAKARGGRSLNRPTIMTLLQLVLTAGAAALLAGVGSLSLVPRLAAACTALVAVPVATLGFRCLQVRRRVPVLRSLLLIQLFYLARGLAVLATVLRIWRRDTGKQPG